MWPFGDTYIVNRVESPSVPSNHQELAELANQTRRLANSNQNIADSLNQDRITISNCRYAELVNKSKLLNVLKQYVNNYFSLIGNLNTNDLYINFYRDPYRFMDACMKYDLYFKLSKFFVININSKDKKIFIKKSDIDFNFDYPEYIPYEEGTTVIIGDKYKNLVKEEILLKEYIKVVENIESISYHFFGDIRNSEVVSGLMKRNQKIEDIFDTNFQYFFDDDLKSVKQHSKYRLNFTIGPHSTNVELKINS